MVVSHPEISGSQTQQFLKKGSESTDAIWHHIEGLKSIEVDLERQLLESADRIIFQFPLYWYSAPAGLKEWLDKVMSRNFVYGDGQFHLEDKEFGLVVTTGLPEKDFQVGGAENMTLDQLLSPYRAFASRAHMKVLPMFLVDQFWYKTEHQQMQLLIDYQRYISQKFPDSLKNRQSWFSEHLAKFVEGLNKNEKPTGNLILDTFQQQIDDLDQLNDTLQMIKEGEDDNLE
ncbi:NAD(P)H-dependent oxidoreductase [Companilactobacillus sp.]|uniref:NAD(P)H-dependent oxidoreductase n=1 Tax=Companilactobacillus sp. TaxID=2767905 RepID=UPI0025BE2CC2|nr:NAD(P)H-dependent oxidoreductase [Companilactobacillus sp.]